MSAGFGGRLEYTTHTKDMRYVCTLSLANTTFLSVYSNEVSFFSSWS